MKFNNTRQSIRSVQKGMLRQKGRRNLGLTILVGLIVAASAYFALSLIGFSYEDQPICGTPEHIHDEFCYSQPELICGLEETEGHMHSYWCFGEGHKLICGIAEIRPHTHTDKCYYTEMELVCGLEETEGNEEEGIEAHRHTDECYYPKFICEIAEHTHDSSCYAHGNNVSSSAMPPVQRQRQVDGLANKTGSGETGTETEEPPDKPPADESGETPETSTPPASGGNKHDSGNSMPPADDRDDMYIVIPETPDSGEPAEETTDPEDAEEPPEGEEETEEPAENKGGRSYSIRPASAPPPAPPEDQITSVSIPVTKRIEGSGALDALGDDLFFSFYVEDTPGGNRVKILNSKGEKVDSIDIYQTDFGGGNSTTVEVTIPVDIDDIVAKGGSVEYTLKENQTSAGDEWMYDQNTYSITITVGLDGSVTTTAKKNDVTGSTVEITSCGIGSTSPHSPTPVPPNKYQPLVSGREYFVYESKEVDWLGLYPDDPNEQLLEPFLEYVFTLDDENAVYEFNALCSDYLLWDPPPIYEEEDIYYTIGEPIDGSAAALFFALFSDEIMHGAHMDDKGFNTLFGFESDKIPGELRKIFTYFLMYYNSNPSKYGDITLGNYKTNIKRVFSNFVNSDPLCIDRFDIINDIVEEMLSFYKITKPGDSITSLKLEYKEITSTTGTITVGYSGYKPVLNNKLALSWDNSSVQVFDDGKEVFPGDEIVLPIVTIGGKQVKLYEKDLNVVINDNNAEPVTFNLIDKDNYFLIGGRIKGSFLETHSYYSKGPLQHLVTGTAEFVKLKADLTVKRGKLDFTNLFAMVELPRTIGLGSNTYLFIGTMLILASLSALFAQGVRPVREGIQDESKARILSLIGKRTRKRWFICRRRE